jgi:hypothetical protein
MKGVINLMQRTTIQQTFLALMLASALPLAACSKNDSPTSPTQPGPPVSTPAPAPAPAPEPTPTPPPPTPPPTDDRPIVSVSGFVAVLDRLGADDLDISFRIDDFTVVRAAAGTPVTFGGQTFNTDAIRPGQQVTAEGRRTNGFLDATKITITAQAP